MIALSKKWCDVLVHTPESGMGYHIVTVVTRDGREYRQSVVNSGMITRVRGYADIPFREEDIQELVVTHDKWDFGRDEAPDA